MFFLFRAFTPFVLLVHQLISLSFNNSLIFIDGLPNILPIISLVSSWNDSYLLTLINNYNPCQKFWQKHLLWFVNASKYPLPSPPISNFLHSVPSVPSLWTLIKRGRGYCWCSCDILQFWHYIMGRIVWKSCQAKFTNFTVSVWVRENPILKV